MSKFRVHLSITDMFVVDVEADDMHDAAEIGLETICQLEKPLESEFYNGTSGFEVTDVDPA